MKLLFSSIVLIGLCIWTFAHAKPTCNTDSTQYINLEVISGTLVELENAFVKVWFVNSAYCLALPVTPNQLVWYTWQLYNTSTINQTVNPSWKTTFNITNEFDLISFVVFELWTQNVEPEYLGGVCMQVQEMEVYDKYFNLAMIDNFGKRAGILALEWNKANNKC